MALLVPSRRELGRSLLGLHQAGYPLRGMSDHAVSESLYLDDPDGNGLEIYADRPRSMWPVRDGVVQMTVDPMDVEGVIAAGRERPEPWTGLAPETVVGHVHFTVSGLEPSVAFYRDVIGFDVMMRIPSLVAVSAGGYHHHLNLNTWAGERAARDSDRVAGLSGWELRVPDEKARKALVERLTKANVITKSSDGLTAGDPDAISMEIAGVPWLECANLGNSIQNRAPPPLGRSTPILPPCASTASLQNVRPRPADLRRIPSLWGAVLFQARMRLVSALLRLGPS